MPRDVLPFAKSCVPGSWVCLLIMMDVLYLPGCVCTVTMMMGMFHGCAFHYDGCALHVCVFDDDGHAGCAC
jgi:hypothetical protein